MTKYAEKRKHPRIDARVKVVFKNENEFVEEYSRNISRGGIFLKTDRLLDPNAVLAIDLYIPPRQEAVSVVGRVRRLMVVSDPEREGEHLYGVGIEFIETNEPFQHLIDDLVRQEEEKKGK